MHIEENPPHKFEKCIIKPKKPDHEQKWNSVVIKFWDCENIILTIQQRVWYYVKLRYKWWKYTSGILILILFGK